MRKSVALVAALAACSPQPSSPNSQRAPIVAAPAGKAAKAEPEPSPAAPSPRAPSSELAEVREPEKTACSLAAADWSFGKLRLREHGPVFARASSANARLLVPVGSEPPSLTAVLDDGQVLVRGVVDTNESEIYLHSPRLLAGILAPFAEARLAVLAGKDNALAVGIDASDVLVSPQVVRDDVPCDALSIKIDVFDARAAITKRAKLPQRAIGPNGADLAKTAGSEAVAKLSPRISVELLETRGNSSRVLVGGSRYFVVGWVATKDLATTQGVGFGTGYGTGRGRLGGRGPITVTDCPHDLDLIAQAGSERIESARVGSLRAGAPFRIVRFANEDRATRGRVPIELPTTSWLVLEKAVELTVLESALDGCKERRINR